MELDPLDSYLHSLVFAADRIAVATRKHDLQVIFREIDTALATPVPGDVYDAGTAVLVALAAQVDVATRQTDRLAWAAKSRPLDPFLRGGVPQFATGIAATVRNADRDGIAHAVQSSLEAVRWPDPVVALAVALGMQVDTDVPMRARNAWTLDGLVEAPAAALVAA